MTNEQRAHKQAKADSRTAPAYVVYVFDEGYSVYDSAQVRTYAPLIVIEALYVDGVCIATAEAAQRVATL